MATPVAAEIRVGLAVPVLLALPERQELAEPLEAPVALEMLALPGTQGALDRLGLLLQSSP